MSTINDLPPAPSRSDDQQTFTTKADALLGSLDEFVEETNTVAAEVMTNASAAESSADDASAASLTALAASAVANTAANQALINAGASAWVSGQTYTAGSPAVSLIDLQTYRRNTTGSGTIDPKNDTANWTRVPLNYSVYSARSSDIQLVKNDLSSMIDITSGTFTQSIAASSVLTSGWWCFYKNSGNGSITLDPNSSETINGVNTLVVDSGEIYYLASNGTNLNAVRIQSASHLIDAPRPLSESAYVYTKDVAVTLPDLTAKKNISLTLPSNLTAFTSNPTTADGWTVNLGFSAGTTKTLAPLAFGSPHGWWGNLTMTPPVDSVTTVGVGAMTCICSAVISSTAHVYVFSQSGVGTQAVAINPVTGAVGAPVLLDFNANQKGHIFAVTSNSFVFLSAFSLVIAGTVSGTTISLGTGVVTPGLGTINEVVQLSATSYLMCFTQTTNNLVVATVSGTTITFGSTATAPFGTTNDNNRLTPVNSTTVLLAYHTGSPQSNSAISLRTISISGTVITLNPAVVTNTNYASIASNSITLVPINLGTSYILRYQNSTSTNSTWYGVNVSGTTVTIGTDTTTVGTSLSVRYRRQTFINRFSNGTYAEASQNYFLPVNSTTGLFAYTTSSVIAVSISGTTLTFGTPLTVAPNSWLLTDVATGTNFYAAGTTSFSRLNVSGTTVTATYTVATSTTLNAVMTDTLTDRTVNYGNTWYAWQGIPTMTFPISSTKYANVNTNVITVYGAFN